MPDRRDALLAILLENATGMPDCLAYVAAADAAEPDTIRVTGAWDSAASHQASLGLPAVRDPINRAKPLIAGLGQRIETRPIGGHGPGVAP